MHEVKGGGDTLSITVKFIMLYAELFSMIICLRNFLFASRCNFPTSIVIINEQIVACGICFPLSFTSFVQ